MCIAGSFLHSWANNYYRKNQLNYKTIQYTHNWWYSFCSYHTCSGWIKSFTSSRHFNLYFRGCVFLLWWEICNNYDNDVCNNSNNNLWIKSGTNHKSPFLLICRCDMCTHQAWLHVIWPSLWSNLKFVNHFEINEHLDSLVNTLLLCRRWHKITLSSPCYTPLFIGAPVSKFILASGLSGLACWYSKSIGFAGVWNGEEL